MSVLPLIFRKQKPFKSIPRYIVLHGTECIGKDDQILKQDMKNKFQLPYLKKDTIIMEKQPDVPFHFVIENIGPDYEPIMMHPFCSPIDYFSDVKINLIDDLQAFLEKETSFYFFSSKATTLYTDVSYTQDTCLIFGSETDGLPKIFLGKYKEHFVTIPMQENARCLNLANSACVGVYEGIRRLPFNKERKN